MILEPVTVLSTKIPHQSRYNRLKQDAQDRQESIGLICPSPVMTSSSPLARNNLHVPVPDVCCMCRDTHVAPKQEDKNKVDVCSDRNELLNMLNILYDATKATHTCLVSPVHGMVLGFAYLTPHMKEQLQAYCWQSHMLFCA
jgi:hypothetical protein